MTGPFSYPPVAQGEFATIKAGHELIWLGGDRILDWQAETAEFRVWKLKRRYSGGDLFSSSPMNEGLLRGHRGNQLLWLGGDSLAAVDRDGGTWKFLRYDREVSGDSTFEPKRPQPVMFQSLVPTSQNAIYLGRGRLLSWDDGGGSYQLWRHDRGFMPILSRLSIARARFAVPPHSSFVWLGGNRLLLWQEKDGGSQVCWFSNKLYSRTQRLVVGPEFPRPPHDASKLNLKERKVLYVGDNLCLDWSLADGSYQLWAVAPATNINLEVEDYLEVHTHVRDSISWRQNDTNMLYKDWDLNSGTRVFYFNLNGFLEDLASGDPPDFSFRAETDPQTGQPRVAPALTASHMSLRDASEIFLAHVAQSLYVELTRAVPWHLHQFPAAQLDLILDSRHAFKEWQSTAGWSGIFATNPEASGNGTPTDPTRSFAFLNGSDPQIRTGPSMIGSTQKETILNIARWVRDHLRHGSNIIGGSTGVSTYGYDGPAPIDRMFTPLTDPAKPTAGPRYYAWFGCHSASALFVWLARSANIPARSWYTHFEDTTTAVHSGLDFPGEDLFAIHSDFFYAIGELLDPTIEPESVFESQGDYATAKAKYTTPPQPGELRTEEVSRHLAIKALDHPTYYMVRAFWEGELYQTALFTVTLQNMGYSESEASQLKNQYWVPLATVLNDFRTQHNLPDADAFALYVQQYEDWKENR